MDLAIQFLSVLLGLLSFVVMLGAVVFFLGSGLPVLKEKIGAYRSKSKVVAVGSFAVWVLCTGVFIKVANKTSGTDEFYAKQEASAAQAEEEARKRAADPVARAADVKARVAANKQWAQENAEKWKRQRERRKVYEAEESARKKAEAQTAAKEAAKPHPSTVDTAAAIVAAHSEVEKRLKAPSTATFAPLYEIQVADKGDDHFFVRSYVDSQNGFGAMVRTHFVAEIQFTGPNEWEMVNYAVAQN